jgi:hypothetical protein
MLSKIKTELLTFFLGAMVVLCIFLIRENRKVKNIKSETVEKAIKYEIYKIPAAIDTPSIDSALKILGLERKKSSY